VAVGATGLDLLWSIGVFVGVPSVLFVVLVVREFRRVRRQRRAWRDEDQTVQEEGSPPGPPVD